METWIVNHRAQLGFLVTLFSVVTAGILGAVLAKDKTTEILGFCSVITVSLLGLLQAQRAAQKADAHRSEINSHIGIQLKLCAVALRRLANLTGTPEDRAQALAAEKALEEHEARELANR